MKQPKRIGIQSCMHIQTRLIDLGYDVSIPIGDNSKYDLIIDINGKLIKAQCKTARIRDDIIKFRLAGARINMTGCYNIVYSPIDVDIFIAYCPDNQGYYILRNKDRPKTELSLRLKDPKNNHTNNIRYAKDFLLTKERLDSLIS